MKKIFFAMVAMLATSMVSVAQSYNYGSNSRRSTTTSTYDSYGTNPSTTSVSGYTRSNVTITDFTLHFSCCFTKLLHSLFITLLNNFTM